MSPVCSEPAHVGMLEASLESCLSKNSRLRAPQSSTDMQPKQIMEEWKVASFKEYIMKQCQEVFLQIKINYQYAVIPSAKRKNKFYL